MNVEYCDIDVLKDVDVCQGIKDFLDWLIIFQFYIKGEFVGGCDIIIEMMLLGELDQLFDKVGVIYDKDVVNKICEVNV